VLVLGGTRSGKSQFAEDLALSAANGDKVTYFATAHVEATDASHQARIQQHRQRRPDHWVTVECPHRDGLIEGLGRDISPGGVALVDSLGTWVAAGYNTDGGPDDMGVDLVDRLVAQLVALRQSQSTVVVVSEEVGLSIHAPSEVGRWFVDAVGTVNQAVSKVADRAVLVVAGRPLELGPSRC